MSVRIRRKNNPEITGTVDDVKARSTVEIKVPQFFGGRMSIAAPCHPRFGNPSDKYLPRIGKAIVTLEVSQETAMTYGDWRHLREEIDRMFAISSGKPESVVEAAPSVVSELEIIDVD
jgi:hypothetical protein